MEKDELKEKENTLTLEELEKIINVIKKMYKEHDSKLEKIIKILS